MIKSWRHKGLRDFFETGSKKGIQAHHADRLRRQLAQLNVSSAPQHMNLPGWRLHRLTDGDWSIWISGNWRMTFRFDDGDATFVDYRDYH